MSSCEKEFEEQTLEGNLELTYIQFSEVNFFPLKLWFLLSAPAPYQLPLPPHLTYFTSILIILIPPTHCGLILPAFREFSCSFWSFSFYRVCGTP